MSWKNADWRNVLILIPIISGGCLPGSGGGGTDSGAPTLDLDAPTSMSYNISAGPLLLLQWNENCGDETAYEIERCLGSSCTAYSPVVGSPFGNDVSNFSDNSLSAGSTYRYRIRCTKNAEIGDWATSSDFIYDQPSAPMELALSNSTTTSLAVGWTLPDSRASSIQVQSCTGSGCSSFSNISSSPFEGQIQTATVTGLMEGQVVRIRVSAVNAIGSSSTVSTDLNTKALSPSGFQLVVKTPTQAQLAWTDNSSSEGGYTIYNCNPGCSALLGTTSANATSVILTDLTPGTLYTLAVRAENPTSDFSSTITFTTPSSPFSFGQSYSGTVDAGALGETVRFLGDLTGDGISEFAISEPYEGASGKGRVYIYKGATLPVNITLLHTLDGPEVGCKFGQTIAKLGDVNGDGRADFGISAPDATGGGTERGKVYIYSAGLDGASLSILYEITGSVNGGKLGYQLTSISNAGDINSDGKTDFLVAEPKPNLAAPGKVYLYAGGVGGGGTPTLINTFTGNQNSGAFGYFVGLAGDINGDNIDDFLISEPFANGSGTQRGILYVYSGSGFSELFSIEGSSNNVSFGVHAQAVGDLNNDSFDDFLVYDSGGAGAVGRTTLYLGRTSGTLTSGFSISGSANSQQLGRFMAIAGDLNGDGRQEFILSEPGYDSNKGRIRVFSWLQGALPILYYELLGSEPGAQLGIGVDGNGDLDADSKPDLLVGETGAAMGGFARGRSMIYKSQ